MQPRRNCQFAARDAQRRANRRCAALSRSVQRPKGARLSAGLGIIEMVASQPQSLSQCVKPCGIGLVMNEILAGAQNLHCARKCIKFSVVILNSGFKVVIPLSRASRSLRENHVEMSQPLCE